MSKLRVSKLIRKVCKPKPRVHIVRVPAWLTRCPRMGYEIWSDKPERIPVTDGGGFNNLIDWAETGEFGSFYFRVPSIDCVPMEMPIHLNDGNIRRIWLNLELTCRRMKHAKGTQTIK